MKNLRALGLFSVAALALACAPLYAQQHASMPGMDMSHPADSDSDSAAAGGESTPAFKTADEKMMHGMSAPAYTGNADQDFVAHMIPHHEGAIDMAEVELKYGKDPDLKRLARNIIKAQRDEVAFLKGWQAKHPAR